MIQLYNEAEIDKQVYLQIEDNVDVLDLLLVNSDGEIIDCGRLLTIDKHTGHVSFFRDVTDKVGLTLDKKKGNCLTHSVER